MSTTKTKKEAKLKARKTSLSKKTNEELIDIILKKDNTERKNNDKIMNLTKKVDDLNVIISAKEEQINSSAKELNETENCNNELISKLNKFQINNDALQESCNSLRNELDSYYKEIKRIKLYKIIGLCSIIVNLILLSVILF